MNTKVNRIIGLKATAHRSSHSFFARPAEQVAPELIGCLLVKRQPTGSLLWGVIVETEAYSQQEPACHGHRRRSPSNETLFGESGRFYVYVSMALLVEVQKVNKAYRDLQGLLINHIQQEYAKTPAARAKRQG